MFEQAIDIMAAQVQAVTVAVVVGLARKLSSNGQYSDKPCLHIATLLVSISCSSKFLETEGIMRCS